MAELADTKEMCVPGQRICKAADGVHAGRGTYVRNGFIYASLCGLVNRSISENKMLNIEVQCSLEHSVVPSVGSIVIAKVMRVTPRFCKSVIMVVNNTVLTETFHGILRREDVRAKEKDQVEMHKSFRPGDVIIAKVLSLGDALSYVLTTAENELGVVVAMSEAGSTLVPISWCEMQCPSTFAKEYRKVARVQPQHCFLPQTS